MNGESDATLAQIIGCNIKKLRESSLGGYGKARSQRECAEVVGASQQQWAAWEAGKNIPGDEYLKAITRMFGVVKSGLWAGSPPPTKAGGAQNESVTRLFSSLAANYKALGNLAESVMAGEIDPKTARQAVVEALDIVLRTHHKQEKLDRRKSSS